MSLDEHKSRILNETKNVSSFVVIGETLDRLYHKEKLVKNQKEFLDWTKRNLGFSKSTTYEYIISYRVYSDIAEGLPSPYRPPMYQSHCQLLSKIPKDQVVSTWMAVCDAAPPGGITTAFLESYLKANQLKLGRSSRVATRKATRGKGRARGRNTRRRTVSSSEEEEEETFSSEEESSEESEPESKTPAEMKKPPTPPKSVTLLSPIATNCSAIIEKTPPKKRPKVLNSIRQFLPELSFSLSPDQPTPLLQSSLTSTPLINSMDQLVNSPLGLIKEETKKTFNQSLIFQLGQSVVMGNQFDIVCQNPVDFQQVSDSAWYGRVWMNLSMFRPLSTGYSVPENAALERALQIVFTKFANNEFNEGLFLIRAEFGADWFTPILQHPYCILRHIYPPDAHFESFVVFYLGPNLKEFCSSYRSVGVVPGVNSWSMNEVFMMDDVLELE